MTLTYCHFWHRDVSLFDRKPHLEDMEDNSRYNENIENDGLEPTLMTAHATLLQLHVAHYTNVYVHIIKFGRVFPMLV